MRNSTPLKRTDKGNAGTSVQRLPQTQKKSFGQLLANSFKRYYWLYLFLVPAVLYYIIFHYAPMGGIVIAFKRYTGARSIWESPWVGLKWFKQFFKSAYSTRSIWNTLGISLYSFFTFPLAIIMAFIFDEVRNKKYKKVAQTIMYAPHFMSMVVIVSMLNLFFNVRFGYVNHLIKFLGGTAIDFQTDPRVFRHMYVWSGVWQNLGWSCIIYVSALSGVDPSLLEASRLDGASRMQQIWHVKLPAILPTVVIMLIMRVGNILDAGVDKVLLMRNDLNSSVAETIGTLVYERGLVNQNYGFSAAVGLMQNIVNFSLLIIVNWISRKVSETSLF